MKEANYYSLSKAVQVDIMSDLMCYGESYLKQTKDGFERITAEEAISLAKSDTLYIVKDDSGGEEIHPVTQYLQSQNGRH